MTPLSLIFISYRRDDSAPYAGRLYDRLTARFGKGQVFMDIDQIGPGEDFVEVIDRKVGACGVAVILIGKAWLNASDADGKRRLDDPEDPVHLEVAAALKRNILVLPVLVGGATMPKMRQLPAPLAMLSRRNAVEISDSRFHADVDKLIEALERAASNADEPGAASALSRRPRWSTRSFAIAAGVAVVAVVAAVGLTTLRGNGAGGPAPGATGTPVAAASLEPAPKTDAPAAAGTGKSNDDRELVQSRRDPDGLGGSMAWLSGKTPDSVAFLLQETKRRASDGSADAQYSLALTYECGQDKNLPLATRWYESAAAQGHAAARAALTALQTPLPSDAREREFATIKRDMDCLSRMQKDTTKTLDQMDDKAREAIKRIKPG